MEQIYYIGDSVNGLKRGRLYTIKTISNHTRKVDLIIGTIYYSIPVKFFTKGPLTDLERMIYDIRPEMQATRS